MLDMNFVLDNVALVRRNTLERYSDANVEKAVDLFVQFKAKRTELQRISQRQNQITEEFRNATLELGIPLKEEIAQLKTNAMALKEQITVLETAYLKEALKIPNLTAPNVPEGRDETKNLLIRQWGQLPCFPFRPKTHVELGEELDIVDFASGARVAGSKFYFLKGEAVLLELALIRYALQTAITHGFTPVATPDLAHLEVITASGFVPRGPESQVYSIAENNLGLIGTSEITIGGAYMDSVLDEEVLPLKIAGISHCFRTEAGSHGAESKGLYRVHQFSKVELYQFTHPRDSDTALEEILAIEEMIYQSLGLPHRVMLVCKGDLGTPAYQKYDIEAWMPFIGEQGGYGEVTSASNCTDFQARRLAVRFKNRTTKKNEFVHTLNGTAIATTRTLLAIMENHQQSDGSVVIPKVLQPYTGFEVIQPKKS